MDSTQINNGSSGAGALHGAESFAKLLEQYERSGYREGEIARGRVIKIEKDYAMIDIGYKSEGLIQLSEFMDLEGKISINIGDEVYVYVESVENDDGAVVLSKEKADTLKIWDLVSNAHEQGSLIEGIVTARVKGGLTVDIGVKAFLPGSQIDLRPVRNLDKYIGQKFSFKVIKYNRKRGNIVLSRRALLEKEREELKKSTLSRLEEGLVVEGVIKNITDYGCFVDLGGIDGLLHTTDMSWGRVKNPDDLFRVGDVVRVKVLKFDQKSEKVSLGVKQLTEDPWSLADRKYRAGDRIKGKIVSFADYGAF
ncbi:MAG: S1 RNA-binding domain-containing protein, partial [Deltaproteobacteria bacterium]|nr:S1 RNA-binding domain-containing protein [Deltaproteobacteria bacterium]